MSLLMFALLVSFAHDAGVQAAVTSATPQVAPTQASVKAELVKGRADVIVHITNHSKLPIEAWHLRIAYDLGAGAQSQVEVTTDTYLNSGTVVGRGPVQPGETRQKTFALPGVPISASAMLDMVLFSDLSAKGSPAERSAVFVRREREARSFSTWSNALQEALTKDPTQARAVLKATLASEDKQLGADSDAVFIAMRQSIGELIAAADSDPSFRKRATDLKQKLDRQREMALRHQVR